MGTKLYVGSLAFKTTEQELEALFAGVGEVKTVNLIKDKFSGESKGFAFVEMNSEQDARNAIKQLDGASVGGRTIIVNEAKEKEPRSGGGGGGFRGGNGGGGGGFRGGNGGGGGGFRGGNGGGGRGRGDGGGGGRGRGDGGRGDGGGRGRW